MPCVKLCWHRCFAFYFKKTNYVKKRRLDAVDLKPTFSPSVLLDVRVHRHAVQLRRVGGPQWILNTHCSAQPVKLRTAYNQNLT